MLCDVNGYELIIELDTRAEANVISKDISDMLDLKLQDSDMEHLVMANNSKLKIVGETDTDISIQNRTFELKFLIVEGVLGSMLR